MARTKGALNRSTEKAKSTLARFLEANLDEMEELFQRIKKDNPDKAFDKLMQCYEYILPKLARTDNVNMNYEKKTEDLDDEDKKLLERLKESIK